MKWLNLIGLVVGTGCQAVAMNNQALSQWLIPIGSIVLLVTRMDMLARIWSKTPADPPAA